MNGMCGNEWDVRRDKPDAEARTSDAWQPDGDGKAEVIAEAEREAHLAEAAALNEAYDC
jgi:hypothetical protein